MGLAMFFPVNGGAEPCTGSNMEVLPGWIFPLAAMPSPPCNRSGKVSDDVAEHVVGHDDVELFRIAHHVHAQGIHVHVLGLDAGVLRGDDLENALPQATRKGHDVGFV